MKLNFASLATQLSSQSQSLNQSLNQSTELNYYRKNVLQSNSSKHLKSRKTQLNTNEESNSFMIGSQILQQYFSQHQTQTNNNNAKDSKIGNGQQRLNLSVMYPYQISRTLNQNNFQNQIQQLKTKGIINSSALKFIKKQVIKDLSKSRQKHKNSIQAQNKGHKQIQKLNLSLYIQNDVKNSKDTSIELQTALQMLNFTSTNQQFLENEQNSSELPLNTMLLKHFLKEAKQSKVSETLNNKKLVKSKYLNPSQQRQPKQLKPAASVTTSVLPRYMQPTHHFQSSANDKSQTPTSLIKLENELKQVKKTPCLELTKKSPFTQKQIEQRQNKYKSINSNVFDSLYRQANLRKLKRSIQRKIKEEQVDKEVSKKKALSTKFSKKYQVDGSFYERLQRSIEKHYSKEDLKQKYDANPKTGHPFFCPDTKLSKHTYQALFHKSLEKPSIQLSYQPLEQENSAKTINSNKKKRLQSQLALSTHFTQTFRSVKHTTQNSLQKASEVDKLNRSLQTIKIKSEFAASSKSTKIVSTKNQNIVERIAELFYPSQQPHQQNKQYPEQEQRFNKSFTSLGKLSQKELQILSPLFTQVQALQKSSSVGKLMFKSVLGQFIKKMNYYDQLTLRQIYDQNKRRNEAMMKKQPFSMKKANYFLESQNCSLNQDNQSAIDRSNYSHCPKINTLSAKMQKLNPKYDQALYYV